jgi:hypothetical protein
LLDLAFDLVDDFAHASSGCNFEATTQGAARESQHA